MNQKSNFAFVAIHTAGIYILVSMGRKMTANLPMSLPKSDVIVSATHYKFYQISMIKIIETGGIPRGLHADMATRTGITFMTSFLLLRGSTARARK